MAKETTYTVDRIEGATIPLPTVPAERDCALRLSDARWQLVFRDGGTALSGGLLGSRLAVEKAAGRTCRVSIEDGSAGGFSGTAVVRSSAIRVRRDLKGRLASLERSRGVVADVGSGQWWLDTRLFDGLDWSGRRSLAGIHYRAGWWGTGRQGATTLPKVLDFGPRGIVLRGWRTRLVIPWDAVRSLRLLAGDAWVPAGTVPDGAGTAGTTVVVRSRTGQDAVFFTPLVPVAEVDDLLEPLVANLPDARSARS